MPGSLPEALKDIRKEAAAAVKLIEAIASVMAATTLAALSEVYTETPRYLTISGASGSTTAKDLLEKDIPASQVIVEGRDVAPLIGALRAIHDRRRTLQRLAGELAAEQARPQSSTRPAELSLEISEAADDLALAVLVETERFPVLHRLWRRPDVPAAATVVGTDNGSRVTTARGSSPAAIRAAADWLAALHTDLYESLRRTAGQNRAFSASLAGDPDHVWRYPPLMSRAPTKSRISDPSIAFRAAEDRLAAERSMTLLQTLNPVSAGLSVAAWLTVAEPPVYLVLAVAGATLGLASSFWDSMVPCLRRWHSLNKDTHNCAMGKLFVERDGTLVEMSDLPFTSEDIFQSLLGRHPALLEGDLLTPDREPRRFVLVAREMAVPDTQDGGGRWSLDHLFLDQDGIPTLVEVKRSSDTRIRREVVGQVMDYAANAVAYWPPSALRQRLDGTHADTGGADEQILTLLGEKDTEPDHAADVVEAYWQTVATNLTAGRVRLLFVADRIERELARIIEFLNAQMSPAEVLGVEIRNYEGDGIRALTPVVIGLTEAALERKSVTQPTTTTVEELWAAASPALVRACELLDAWSDNHGLTAASKGKSRRYMPDWLQSYLFAAYPTYDRVYFNLDKVHPNRRDELRQLLASVLGHPVTAVAEPGVHGQEFIDKWDQLQTEVLPAFVEASRNPASWASPNTPAKPTGPDAG